MVKFATMRRMLAEAGKTLDGLEKRHTELDDERKRLEKLPMSDASPYWHEEKYLYLIHRTVDGFRARKYVGCKPDKVKAALDSITHFQQHETICREEEQLRNRLVDANYFLQQFVHRLRGK